MDVQHVYPEKRLNFPADETRLAWLALLLDAYSIVDQGVEQEIAKEAEAKGRNVACGEGCANCCRIHAAVPVYPLEMAGMAWYCTEQVAGETRQVLITQLEGFEQGDPCPFLVNDSCAVHALRPMACRQFNVFDTPCAEGEDPFYSRREDVLTPSEPFKNTAFRVTLPFYGIVDETDKDIAIKENHIHRQVRVLQQCNWKELAKKMRQFSAQQPSSNE
ncbi:YkgJ family cysteine cluster protein [Desulfonatronum thioautotrophicum]|uniref:YkgJ family cysteine cluster protein n=1 Tax=Desulfonatronum thioautotrophicum TaxID=617001 RepID=UPI00069B587F|nr:YkgJ family cysteine cluster protein [Desulfonatronum thioautotrophicum]